MSITASKYGGLAQQLISEGIVSEAHMKTAQTTVLTGCDRH